MKIETSRLILFSLSSESLALLINNEDVFYERYDINKGSTSPTESIEHIIPFLCAKISKVKQGYLTWLIIEKNANSVIGSIGFKGDPIDNSVDLGYAISKGFADKGYATEAIKKIVDWAFLQSDIYKITANTENLNFASQKVLKKNGFECVEKGLKFNRYCLAKDQHFQNVSHRQYHLNLNNVEKQVIQSKDGTQQKEVIQSKEVTHQKDLIEHTHLEKVLPENLSDRGDQVTETAELIKSKRFTVRKAKLCDSEAIYRYRNDKQVKKFQLWHPKSSDTVAQYILDCQKSDKTLLNSCNMYVIVYKSHVVGDIMIKHIAKFQVELGITVSPAYQKQNIAYEALGSVINHLFQNEATHRIVSSVDPDNVASIALMQKLHFTKEAHFIQSFLHNDSWYNDVIFALRRASWTAYDV